MGNFKGAARTALATLAILLTLPPAGARAEESLVIFSPAKISLHAYRLRMGARAAAEADMSAGVDLSVTTSSAGRISDTRDNARLWAEMRGEGRSGAERSVTAGYNPLTGRVSATLGVTRRWMPSQAIDVAVTPSVSADANMRHGARGSVRVTQKARISAVRTGTSFVASGTATTGAGGIGTEFGVEQRVFERLDLGASVRRQDAGLVGAVSAQLRFEW
jgi:hypothetical protein